MSQPASERAERIARDVPITPHVAPLGAARTAQRAVPTYRTAFANHRHGRAGVLACRFVRLPAARGCSTVSSLRKLEAGCPKNRQARTPAPPPAPASLHAASCSGRHAGKSVNMASRRLILIVGQVVSLPVLRACLETTRGAVFGEKAGWQRDEGEYPWWIFD